MSSEARRQSRRATGYRAFHRFLGRGLHDAPQPNGPNEHRAIGDADEIVKQLGCRPMVRSIDNRLAEQRPGAGGRGRWAL